MNLRHLDHPAGAKYQLEGVYVTLLVSNNTLFMIYVALLIFHVILMKLYIADSLKEIVKPLGR